MFCLAPCHDLYFNLMKGLCDRCLVLQIVGPHQETSVLTQLGDVPDGRNTQDAAG